MQKKKAMKKGSLKFPDRDFLNRKEEPKQSAEAPLNAKDIYFNLCAKYIDSMDRSDVVSMAMEEHRQQGIPTEEEIKEWIKKEMPINVDDDMDEEVNKLCRKSVRLFGEWMLNKWKGQ